MFMSVKKIVIIDDDVDIGDTIKDLLTNYGYKVVYYNSSRNFIDYAFENGIDDVLLLIVDVMLPEIGGMEMLSMLDSKEMLKDCPVLFFSGYPDDREISSAFLELSGLAFDYIPKPITHYWFLAKVKNLIRIKEDHDRMLNLSDKMIEAYKELEDINGEITDILKETKWKNEYLAERLKKVLARSENTKLKSQLTVTRDLFSKIISTDLTLLKLIKFFLSEANQSYMKLFFEESKQTEIFKILPEMEEPAATVIADLHQVHAVLEQIGLVDDSEGFSGSQFSVYEKIEDMYKNSEITGEFFDKIKTFFVFDDTNASENDDTIILF